MSTDTGIMVVKTTVASATDLEVGMNDFGKEFSIIHRYSMVYMSKLLMEYNIPGRVVPYFMEICAQPGISQEQIAKNLKIDKGAVARTVKVMVDEGIVERKENPEDKRGYQLYPTEKMKKINEKNEEAREKLENVLTEGMSEGEIQTCRMLLQKMAENMVNAVSGDSELRAHEAMLEEKINKDIRRKLREER